MSAAEVWAEGFVFMERTYIMGYGRSGSTLFESILSAKGTLNVFGEIKYLAQRGVLKNERCSCGTVASDCKFWSETLKELGDWDYSEVSRVTDRLDSSKMFFINVLLARMGFIKQDIALYQSFNDKLFAALERHGGFIDSSKMPARLYFLSQGRDCPYSEVVWFVRDPRGVAWSCMKDVVRPESRSAKDAKMPKFGFFPSIIKWVINSWVSSYVARKFKQIVRLRRYEDLQQYLDAAEQVSGKGIVQTHSISGNPGRFTGGLCSFRLDDEWKQGLTPWQKKTAGIICWPWSRAMSYKISS